MIRTVVICLLASPFVPRLSAADTEMAGIVKCMQKVVEAMPSEIRTEDGPYLFIPPAKGSPDEGINSMPAIVTYDNANRSGEIKIVKALGTVSIANDATSLSCPMAREDLSSGSSAFAREFLRKYFSGQPRWYVLGTTEEKKRWDQTVEDCKTLYPTHPAFQ